MKPSEPFILNATTILENSHDLDEQDWEDRKLQENDDKETTEIRAVLFNYGFDDASYEGVSSDNETIINNTETAEITLKDNLAHSKTSDPLLYEVKKIFHKYDVLPSNHDLMLKEIIELIRNNIDFFEPSKDSNLREIDISTPISYWRKECPELFDYPENMHGFKTSWDFLKGVYNPSKHKKLYYNDLKEINHKLYRAVYRRNSKEKFLPTHNDRIADEIKAMKDKKLKLSDIEDPKLKERFRMRFHHDK